MQFDLRPMLATLTDKPFDDPDWVFETKWDGFRVVAVAERGKVTLYSRNGLDVSSKYPSICKALRETPHTAVFDGELVALDAHGRSRFQLLQNAEREPARLSYSVFDLLYLDGKDLRRRPLLERKEALEAVLPESPVLHYSTHVVGKGITAFNRAKRAEEEGVMAKLASGRYYSGQRTREWLKVKASQGQEVVIVGFTARAARENISAPSCSPCVTARVGNMSDAPGPASIRPRSGPCMPSSFHSRPIRSPSSRRCLTRPTRPG